MNLNTNSLSRAMNEIIPKILDDVPVGIIVFNSKGIITFVNKRFRDFELLYNLKSPSSLTGTNILETELFANQPIQNELNEILKGCSVEKELNTINTKKRGSISLILKGAPVSDDEEGGGILMLEDIKVVQQTGTETYRRNDLVENALERSCDFFLVTDNQNDLIFYSRSTLHHLNKDPENLTEVNLRTLFSEGAYEKILNVVSEKSSEEISFIIEESSEEKQKFFEYKVSPQIGKTGSLVFSYLFFNDVTDKQSEAKRLKKNIFETKYYQEIISVVNDALFVTDKEGKVTYWDEASQQLFGVDLNEVKGKFFGEFIKPFDLEYFNRIITQLKETDFVKVNLTVFRKDQKREIYEIKFSQSREETDRIIVLLTNITSNAQETEQLKDRFESYKELLNKSSQPICKLDAEANFIFVNNSFVEALDYSENEILQLNFYEIISPEFFDENTLDLRNSKSDKLKNIPLPLINKSGRIVHFLTSIYPELHRDNTIRAFNCYLNQEDVDAGLQGELKLYKSLLKSSLDGIALASEGKIVIANDAFAEIFGYDNSEKLINKDLLDLSAKEDVLKVAEYFRLIEKNKTQAGRFEFLGLKSDGTKFYSEISTSRFTIDDKIYISMLTRDVTERVRGQKAIKESEEKYRNITENIDDFLFTFERIGKSLRPVFYTASVEKITGYSQSEFLTDSRLFFKIIHPADFTNVKEKMTNLMNSRLTSSGEFEFRIINKQGNVVWVRNKINLARDGKGKIQKVYGLVSDISPQKKAEDELKKSTEDLLKLNETKDKFISIVSHDLRTPFSSILGFTDLLKNDEELTEEERRQYVEYIQESSRSMLNLVNSLLDWTRLQTGRIKFETQKIDAHKIIDDSVNTLKGTAFQKNIEIESAIPKDEVYIFVDKHLISQVFHNLLSNAIKFTNPGGKISLSVDESKSSSRFVEFSVRDNGVGIKEENLEKLFSVESKFTSEGTAGEKGSGLGLSLVKEIVEKHGGKIDVSSIYSEGTEFVFTLPIASANILLVDDNKTDRILYSKILKNITPDYNVDIASNGAEAIAMIKDSSPALVITDHDMPIMDGFEFVQQLEKEDIKGKPPVIILSSDIDRSIAADYHQLGIEYVFSKPVNLTSFKNAVEKSLKKGMISNK